MNQVMGKPLALIVEDDESLADIYSQALQIAGFKTEVIMEGSAASTRLSTITPMLVVLDLHLPNVSGRDILRQIRASEQLANTQVIIATADPAMAELVRPDADFVLIKPISFSQLRNLAIRLIPSDKTPTGIE